jgi:serine/threonine protein phosphatase PrpC
VSETPRNKDKDSFIVVACDGIWDCVSNEECTKRIKKKHADLKI